MFLMYRKSAEYIMIRSQVTYIRNVNHLVAKRNQVTYVCDVSHLLKYCDATR